MLRVRYHFFLPIIFWLVAQVSTSDLIVIGAGPSGIAAATKLLENNITDFVILEAEGRIGGRIYSVKFVNTTIDLGGQWCHGIEGNIVYELVKDLNVLEDQQIYRNYVHSSHQHIDQDFAAECLKIFNRFYESTEDKGDLTLGDYMLKNYNETIQAEYGENPEKLELSSILLRIFMQGVLALDGSFSWFDQSASSDYKECEGSQLLNWKGRGYKTVLEVLMKKYPNPENQLPIDDKIILNKEVAKITWGAEGQKIECHDGSVYHADQILFTPSLGVLKHNYKTLFNPSLPQDKINAIEELGFGAVFKVFFHFPTQWWPSENFSEFNLIWADKDRQMLLQEFPEGPNENGQSWLSNFLGLYEAAESPNTLTAWFAGEFIPQIETCSDELLKKGIMHVTKKFLGNQFNISEPDSMIRNNWYSNPHFHGTYSFQTVASRKREVSAEVVLSQPLTSTNGKPLVLFAGEATHPFYYSTVHGAIESGHREAERILSSHQRILSD